MQIIKEKLDIDETLNKKIKNILKFLNIKKKIQSTVSIASKPIVLESARGY